MSELISDEPNLLIAVFILLIFLILILTGVVLRQQKKIKEVTTPRYGFLGKPVAVVIASLMFGLAGFTLYLDIPPRQPEGVSVSDDTQLSLNISYTVLDEQRSIYILNVTPLLDNSPWGQSNNHIFSIEWEITKDNSYTFTKRQENVTQETYRGLIESLESGSYKIRARVLFNNLEASKELGINIE